MHLIRTVAASGAAMGGAGYLLVRCAPAPAELTRQLQAPHDWIAQVGTDAALATVAGALLWLCALWVAVGLTAVWIGQLPGLAGRLGRTVTHCAVPVAIQRLVATSAGFSLLLGGGSAEAAGQPASSPGIAASAAASATAAPGWPLDQPAATRSAEPPSGPVKRPSDRPPPSQPVEGPAPNRSAAGGWPLDPSAGTKAAGPSPTSTPTASTASTVPGQPTTQAKPARPAKPAEATVPVRPGDSLWTIAAAELDPAATDQQIAVAWPYWYRANRSLIGRDPNLLRPGTRLSRPAGPPGERPEGRPSNQSQPIREGLRP
jgi:hypothetical protein